jgi:hypothetical protein
MTSFNNHSDTAAKAVKTVFSGSTGIVLSLLGRRSNGAPPHSQALGKHNVFENHTGLSSSIFNSLIYQENT